MSEREVFWINEIFCSPQGEGIRSGTLNHFVRFAFCNMKCDLDPGPLSPGGFACDTEFESARKITFQEILDELQTLNPRCKNVILTGGEPLLQVNASLIRLLRDAGYYLAIETNGSKGLPQGVGFGDGPSDIQWITVSPKVAEHAIRMLAASEVKYVRGYGQAIPQPTCKSEYKLISPAFAGMTVDPRAAQWCVKLINDHPDWRISIQGHKLLSIR